MYRPCAGGNIRGSLSGENPGRRNGLVNQDVVTKGVEFEAWVSMTNLATVNAVTSLSLMINEEIEIFRLSTKEIPVFEAQDLLGKPEDVVVGVYLAYRGAAAGHIVLAFPETTALEMIDLTQGLEPGTTSDLDDMGVSVMGEMGNVAGTFFLNQMANTIEAIIFPSPPAVINDMAGAIMDVVISQVMETHENLYLVGLGFSIKGRNIKGQLLVVPVEGVLSPGEGYFDR